MSDLVLVDSSYYIRRLSQREKPFDELDAFGEVHDFAVCGIVWVEVLRGRSDPALRSRFDARFATMIFLNLTSAAWRRAAALAWQLDRTGAVVPVSDVVIAACAIEHGAILLTFDRHFRTIPGLFATDHLE